MSARPLGTAPANTNHIEYLKAPTKHPPPAQALPRPSTSQSKISSALRPETGAHLRTSRPFDAIPTAPDPAAGRPQPVQSQPPNNQPYRSPRDIISLPPRIPHPQPVARDLSMEGGGASSESQAGLRACDQCRTRKIRCDKTRPCASCRASDLVCQASSGRPKEQRQRVLISSKYESKIDAIGDRLAGIERALKDMKMAASQVASPHTFVQPTPSPSAGQSVSATPTAGRTSNIQHFEGDTSLSAYSTSTSDQLQKALRNTQLLQQDPDLAAALTSLSQIVSTQNVYPGEDEMSSNQENAKNKRRYGVPPAEVVSTVLRDCEAIYDTVIGLFYPVRPYKEIIDLCKDLYFNIDDIPVSSLIVAFGSLYFIFRVYQFGFAKNDPRQEEFHSYTVMFVRNMMDLIGLLPVLMAPTMDNFEALLLGAYYAVESSKPSLCSALISKASHLCLTLGYHRADSMVKDSTETRARKINMFWFLYTMDKGLCLRLGRASTVQDYDIGVPLPVLGAGEDFTAGNTLIRFWCTLAGIQGRVYEDLYSLRALKQPKASRAVKADKLVTEIRQMWNEHDQIGHIPGTPEDTNEVFLLGDKVTMSTTLTLVLRAVPAKDGQPFSCSEECIAAARQALQLHQTCTARFADMSDRHIFAEYLHWTLLHTPFTPFLVIFCHIIETQSTSDLAMLGDFLQTLQPARGLSSAIEKMFLVCDVFHRVAKLFIGAAARDPSFSNPTTPDQPTQTQLRKELDPFMTRIGINNAYDAGFGGNAYSPYTASTQPNATYDMNAFAQSGTMGEWFSEDQLITTLLGNDFNFMDPNTTPMMGNGGQFM
ncbi:hypothetical protein OPT61_g1761 [Boeremia exigua]|uniref:Uncharacterized protein n=1 Tax=Boeremia exigua TaxID=749465 RepID=A0ACC2IPE9_9PLEO|nr:hypothetical protein OPT61_g1761 [Boeremia exigua]